jgi:hypothetical protein
VDIRSKVKKELQVPMVRRFDAASRLEDFREDLTNLMQTAIVSAPNIVENGS